MISGSLQRACVREGERREYCEDILETRAREEVTNREGFEMTIGTGSLRGKAKEEIGVSEASFNHKFRV